MTGSLDDFRRCEVAGCLWNVLHPATRCYKHGGPPVPQYATDSEGGLLAHLFMPAEVRASQDRQGG